MKISNLNKSVQKHILTTPRTHTPSRRHRTAREPTTMDWACLNDAPALADADAERKAKRTQEAEESRLASSYESALRLAADGSLDDAIDGLRKVLSNALLNREDASSRTLRVKFLALKNLGKLLERRAASAEDGAEALRCYARAVEMDDGEAALWGRLGRLACAKGELGVGRMAYERATSLSPRNQLFLEDLSELCLTAGDFESARAIAGAIAAIDPANARARAMKRAPETLEPTRAMKAAREAAAPLMTDQDEVAIRFGVEVEKTWGIIAAVLARLGGLESLELKDADKGTKTTENEGAGAMRGETPQRMDTNTTPPTPAQSKETTASPSGVDDDDENEDGVLTSSVAAYMKSVQNVEIPRDVMGRKIRFVFEQTPAPASPIRAPIQSMDQAEVMEIDVVTTDDAVEPTPSQVTRELPASQSEKPGSSTPMTKRVTKSNIAPSRKSRRQEDLDAKKAIEEEKARIIAEQEAAQRAVELEERKRAAEARKWKPEVNVSHALLKLIGAEDPVVAAVKKATTDVAAAADRALSLKKKHQKEQKEAAAKKAALEREKKTSQRVLSFISGIDGANGGAAHVAWRFLSTTAARWRPDAEDDCAPDPWAILTLYRIYGAGPGDELSSKARVLLCLADTCILAARSCALGQPNRTFFRNMAVKALEKAAIEMEKDLSHDFHAESLFLRHKLADLDGEEPSVSKYYLDQAQNFAPDESELPKPPNAIDDAAPVRFSKQSLRAAMDAMKVKEVVTGAASRFAKGQTAELVSSLTPLLVPDDEDESAETPEDLSLTQSEKQDALKVLAAAAKKEGSSCVVIELKALKMVYDLTKDHTMIRLMAEAIESASTTPKFSKLALDTAESLGLQSLAALLFEAHYTELAAEPSILKKNKTSRIAAASMEASALLIASVQYASKAKDAEVIELHEKLHDRLADCRCCCGEARKGVFLRSSLVHLAKCRNRITKARDQRHANEPSNQRKTKVNVMKRVGSHSDGVGQDDDADGESRRRVRRQRSKVSSVEGEDRTPQDKADRKMLIRLDKLIIQLCYCLYGFELERPTRRCRDEGGACDSMLKITSERDAADLWLAIQPYAIANKDPETGYSKQIKTVLTAIREKIQEPPRTHQGVQLERYLAASVSSGNVGVITEEDRQLARALISQPTADRVIASTRTNSTPTKDGVLQSPIATESPREATAIKSAEAKISSFADVYKTLFQFCAEVDLWSLEVALEDEATDYQDLYMLLESVTPWGVSNFMAKRASKASSQVADETESLSAPDQSAEVTRMCKLDIEYNPTSPQSWIALADHLDNVKDIVLNDAAKIVPVLRYRNSNMMPTVQMVQLAIRRSLVAAEEALIMTHYAGHPETEWVRSQIYDRLGQTAYEHVQDSPPVYDGREFALDKTSEAFVSSMEMSKYAFHKAATCTPDQWTYPYFLAKLAKKSGESLQDVLKLHHKAWQLKPGSIEACYQVQNIRVRLLMSISVEQRKKMTPESQAITLSVLKMSYDPAQMQNSWIGAYRDAVEALLAVHKNYPTFHKANYRIAWARLKKSPGDIGHCKKALEYLHPLFRHPRTGTFKVCMVEIDDANLRIKSNREDEEGIVYESGINESRRRYISNIRRALRLYLSMLYTIEDVQTLAAASSYISDYKSTAKTRLPVIALNCKDIKFFSLGLLLRALTSMLAQKDASNEGSSEVTAQFLSRDALLEMAYNLWFEFAIPARGNVMSWEQNVEAAYAQLECEEKCVDESVDLVRAPYAAAFFNAKEILKTSPLLNFERFALDRVKDLESREDMNSLAANLSLCQNRIKEFSSPIEQQVRELGSERLRTLVEAHKEAFIRCSTDTIELLASGKLTLRPSGFDMIELDDDREMGDDRTGDAAAAATTASTKSSTNFSEVVLVTARRLHAATKQESSQRVNDYITERRNSLQKMLDGIDAGSSLSDLGVLDPPLAAKTYAERKETELEIERLKKLHSELVEKAMATESAAADPEQLKLVRTAYEDLTTANEKFERLKSEDAINQTQYREETASIAQQMGKSDITNADSAKYLIRVVSAIARREITDIDEAEREAETRFQNLRKLASDLRKKSGRSRARKPATKDAAVADPVEQEQNNANVHTETPVNDPADANVPDATTDREDAD